MATNKTDRAFKTLINKLTTDGNKRAFEELGAETININSSEIWAEPPQFDDPSIAVATGRAQLETLFVLDEDVTVPSQQAWVAKIGSARAGDWVSDKYGPLYAAHLYDGNNQEIFPADASDWFFDYQTGYLTFSGDTSGLVKPFKVTAYRYTGAKGVSSGGGSGSASTTSSLVVPVDYNDPLAVDPPAGAVFVDQDSVDDFLVSEGAPAFKHLELAWEALPQIIRHTVTMNLAAGVHRPAPGYDVYGFSLDGKILVGDLVFGAGPIVTIQGASGSSYVEEVPSNSVSLVGADPDDPWIDFVGTPFTGLDLRGLFFVGDSGLVSPIHSNTNSRLYLTSAANPVPSSGAVARPGTVLRNAMSDGSLIKAGSSAALGVSYLSSPTSRFHVQDIQLDPWSAGWALRGGFTGNSLVMIRCLVDHAYQSDAFGVPPGGRGIQNFGKQATIIFWSSSIRGGRLASSPSEDSEVGIFLSGAGAVNLNNSYIGGLGLSPIAVDGAGASLQISRSVLDDCSDYGAQLSSGAALYYQDNLGSGRRLTIRNCDDGILLESGSLIPEAQYKRALFEGVGTGVTLGSNVFVSALGSSQLGLNGSSNTDVGWSFIGANSTVELSAVDDVTGSVGDVRMGDGSLLTYAEIDTESFLDGLFNKIRRA